MRVIDVSKQVHFIGLTNFISTVIGPKLDKLSCEINDNNVKLTLVTPLRSKTQKFDVLSGTAFETSYLISLSLDSTKRVWFPSM